MVCGNCGSTVSDGSKFCSQCGTKIQVQSKKFCTACGAELTAGQLFCSVCGIKLDSTPPAPKYQISLRNGTLLRTLNMVSMYNGEPTVGVCLCTGKLSVYNDRIEFKKQMGNPSASALGALGLIGSVQTGKKGPLMVYPLAQISQLRVGSYMGLYNTLVIVLKDGTVTSFCPITPGSSEPKNIVNNLRAYM